MSNTFTISFGLTLRQVAGVSAVMVAVAAQTVVGQWPQWGGPNRDFTIEAKGLADSWPEDGPPRVWSRELGDGFASVIVEDGVLYTHYRKAQDYEREWIVALDAKTGATIWEQGGSSPVVPPERMFPGPHSTPLVCGDNLFTVGRNAVIRTWFKKTGEQRWEHDLVAEFGAAIPPWGFASSPIAYKNMVIVLMGCQPYDGRPSADPAVQIAAAVPDENRASLVAFDQDSGAVVWKSQEYRSKYTSPILMNRDGKDQLIFLPRGYIVSVDPANGKLLWEHELPDHGAQVTMPYRLGEDVLFMASTSFGRMMKLGPSDGSAKPEDVWVNKKLNVHVSPPALAGDLAVLSQGGQGSNTLLMGADLRTGERLWAQRGFAEAMLLYADEKVIILDEKGQLALGKATPEGLSVLSTWQLPDWSGQLHAIPTLVGGTLYVRDRKNLMALDLTRPSSGTTAVSDPPV